MSVHSVLSDMAAQNMKPKRRRKLERAAKVIADAAGFSRVELAWLILASQTSGTLVPEFEAELNVIAGYPTDACTLSSMEGQPSSAFMMRTSGAIAETGQRAVGDRVATAERNLCIAKGHNVEDINADIPF